MSPLSHSAALCCHAPPTSRWRAVRLLPPVLLLLAALLPPAEAGASVRDRIAQQARWDVGAALPDGPVDEPVFERVAVHLPADDLVLVCLVLAFRTPDPGRTRAAILYARGGDGRLVPLGPPLFHGPEWARGHLPLADACAAAEAGR
ncbi:hypothetical protein [Muricoccus radiodurans]|uniref:hypothetical protein n=1 Tax=Muricoccus radiodurans TaxID=2231721 RepID=UPI003CF72AAB